MRRYWFGVKNHFWNFHHIFTFWEPWVRKPGFYESVCLSVVIGRMRLNDQNCGNNHKSISMLSRYNLEKYMKWFCYKITTRQRTAVARLSKPQRCYLRMVGLWFLHNPLHSLRLHLWNFVATIDVNSRR